MAVNGQSVSSLSADRAANMLQGPSESTVELTVVALDGQSRRLTLRRERVEVPSVDEIRILPGTPGVAYVKLVCFQKTTFRDLESALWTLHRDGMRSLVVDLRGNPGGLLVAAVEAADLFIDQGVIVSTHGRSAQEDFTYTRASRAPGICRWWSSSIRTAQRRRDLRRGHPRPPPRLDHRPAELRKRIRPGHLPIEHGHAGVRLTTAKFYSPNGYPYSGVGVDPDIVVHQVAKPIAGAYRELSIRPRPGTGRRDFRPSSNRWSGAEQLPVAGCPAIRPSNGRQRRSCRRDL